MDTLEKQNHNKKITWPWREWFSKSVLENGRRDEENGKIIVFAVDPSGTRGTGTTQGGFSITVDRVPASYTECVDAIPWNWKKKAWRYEGFDQEGTHRCNCSQGINGQLCRHLAAFMFHWEKVRGPFVFTQSEEERQEEIRRVKAEQEERARREKEEGEKKRLEEEKRRKEEREQTAGSFLEQEGGLPDIPQDTVFRPDEILGKMKTNALEVEVYESLSEREKLPSVRIEVDYDKRMGDQILNIFSKTGGCSVEMTLGRDRIRKMRCDCGRCYYDEYSYYLLGMKP